MATERISLAKESGGGAFDIPSLPNNLLAFYYENHDYRKAESEGIVPRRRQIVVEMLLTMLNIEDVRLLEKLISDIVLYEVEFGQTTVNVVDLKERIGSMLKTAQEMLKVDKAVSTTSLEEDVAGLKKTSQLAKRLALGVIQSNTESSYLQFKLGHEMKYVIYTAKPCTPLRVLLWITKEEKSAADYLDPSSSDFNPSLISRIEALRSLIRNGIKCILLYEVGNDLSDKEKSIVCESLNAKIGNDLSFDANLPKGFFDLEVNLKHSGALFYSVDRNVDLSPSSLYSNVNFAWSINATQYKQHPHLDTIVVSAGNPKHDQIIFIHFKEAVKFISEYIPEEFAKVVDLPVPSTSKK